MPTHNIDSVMSVVLELKGEVGELKGTLQQVVQEVKQHNKKLDNIDDKANCIDGKVKVLIDWRDSLNKRVALFAGAIATIVTIAIIVIDVMVIK